MLGYLKDHWRGRLSLPRAYWVNVVLVSVLFGALLGLLGELWVPSEFQPIPVLLALVVLWLITTVLYVWQLVGTWRSANRYVAEKQRRFWPRLVKLVLLIGGIGAAGEIHTGYLQIKDVFDIARGKDALGEAVVTLLNEQELEIDGFITFAVPPKVERYLARHPSIETINLNSPGGRIGPSRLLRDLIDRHELATVTSAGCYSSCVIAFMAGRSRILHEGASIGLHQYDWIGVEGGDIRREERIDREYFARQGLSRHFLDRAFSTPPSGMYIPTLRELSKEHLVTHVFDGQDLHEIAMYCYRRRCD